MVTLAPRVWHLASSHLPHDHDIQFWHEISVYLYLYITCLLKELIRCCHCARVQWTRTLCSIEVAQWAYTPQSTRWNRPAETLAASGGCATPDVARTVCGKKRELGLCWRQRQRQWQPPRAHCPCPGAPPQVSVALPTCVLTDDVVPCQLETLQPSRRACG